jgi:hypothetical protein
MIESFTADRSSLLVSISPRTAVEELFITALHPLGMMPGYQRENRGARDVVHIAFSSDDGTTCRVNATAPKVIQLPSVIPGAAVAWRRQKISPRIFKPP